MYNMYNKQALKNVSYLKRLWIWHHFCTNIVPQCWCCLTCCCSVFPSEANGWWSRCLVVLLNDASTLSVKLVCKRSRSHTQFQLREATVFLPKVLRSKIFLKHTAWVSSQGVGWGSMQSLRAPAPAGPPPAEGSSVKQHCSSCRNDFLYLQDLPLLLAAWNGPYPHSFSPCILAIKK